jgi:uncharacterized protein (DUF885 family)
MLDSLVAVRDLRSVADDHWRHLVFSRPDFVARTNTAITSLPDPTQDRLKKDAQFARAALTALDEVDVDALAQDNYVTWLVLRWEMEAMAGWAAFHWTNVFDLSPGISVLDRASRVLASQNITDVSVGQRFTGMLSTAPAILHALRTDYEERFRRGIRLSRPAAARAVTHLRSLIAPPAMSPFGLPRSFQASPDTAWHAQLTRTVEDVITQQVNPSLTSLAALIEREHALASDTLGMFRLPGGPIHYATLLRYRTTLDVSPEDAHAIGLREVVRIRALAEEARRGAGLPADRDSLRAILKRDTTFLFDERSSIQERAAHLYERISTDMEPHFGQVPVVGLSIGVLTAVTDMSPLAIYDPATEARPGAMYLLNAEQLISRSALLLPGLVTGDLMPGRHLQEGTQLENAELPLFRRLGSHDGFVRGWQIYAIDVADSLSTTFAPWERFGLRLRALAAACGLVVDTGINALGWSGTDALNFLRAYLPDDDADLEREFIFPATESPGTLAAAALGARELRGLRRWVMRELGDRFSLQAFHAELLRTGSVPLPVLGSHLERWIWDQKNPAPPPAATRR